MKKIHYGLLLLVLGSLQTLNSYGQMLGDRFGNPVKAKTYTEVEGSPYLFGKDAWLTANVILNDGASFTNVPVKYDLVDDKLFFKSTTNETMEFQGQVKEFTLAPGQDKANGTTFRSGYNVPDFTVRNYFEVLADGKTQLIKKTFKKVAENKIYGSANVTKTFVENVKYYMVSNGTAVPVRNDKKTVLAALSGKQTELETYIKQNNLNLKKDEDLARLIAYYNSI